MTETEFALLELRLLKAGRPYHVHTGDRKFICTSPYCEDLFSEKPRGAPGERDNPSAEWDHGEVD